MKKYSILYYSIILIACIAFLGIIKTINIMITNEEKNTGYTIAIVLDDFYTIKGSNYFMYEFKANSGIYNGCGLYYPKSDKFTVGDTIIIAYEELNPKHNKPIREYSK